MQMEETRMANACVLRLSGRLDAGSTPQLEQRLNGLLEDGISRVVLHMQELDFVASAGLRIFLIFAKKMKKANGGLAFCHLQPGVEQVFDMSGFLNLFKPQDDCDAALATLCP